MPINLFTALGTPKEEFSKYIKLFNLNVDDDYFKALYNKLLTLKASEIMPFLYEVPNLIRIENRKKTKKTNFNPEIKRAKRYCQFKKINFSSIEEALDIYNAYKEKAEDNKKKRIEKKEFNSSYKKIYCLINDTELEFNSLIEAQNWYSKKYKLSFKGAKSAIYRSLTKGNIVNDCVFYRKVEKNNHF